jgi:hypothetical protein
VRYYFNIRDGKTMLDEQGIELNDMKAVKEEALRTAPDMIRAIGDHIWNGEDWVLWVSDQPNGRGKTVLTLTLTSRLAA